MFAYRKMAKAFLLLAVGALLSAAPQTAYAAAPEPFRSVAEDTAAGEGQTGRSGQLTVTLTDGREGTTKEGVVFGCTKVAELQDGEYQALERYEGVVDFRSLETAQQMEEAANRLLTMTEQPDRTVVTDRNGKAVIPKLSAGVWLIDVRDRAGYEEVTPFLAALPYWNEEAGKMEYQAEIMPKHEPLPEKPERPVAPQTNLDSRYGLFFTCAAGSTALSVLFFALGRRKKRDQKGGQCL